MTQAITSFAQAHRALQAFLPDRLSRHAYTPAHIQEFLAAAGNPQETFRVVHVAGTSGKTSTAYYAAALLQAAGEKVGLTVSPHVDEINERVQINLVPLPEKQYCAELTIFLDVVASSSVTLTYFELLVAFAFWEFARQKMTCAVVEVGIGGLADATNVIERQDKLCVITDIGLDHQHVLGDTLGEIAAQKAGIIQLHNNLFCYRQGNEVMAPIRARCVRMQANVHLVDAATPEAARDLPLFQQRNFTLAQAAAEFMQERTHHLPLTDAMLRQAAGVYVPARMEIIKRGGKTIILDGAHNAQKLQALRQSIAARFPDQPVAALASFAARRAGRVETASAELVKLAGRIIVTSFGSQEGGSPQSEDTAIIAAECQAHGGLYVTTEANPEQAFQKLLACPEPVLVVTGSFYLLNHIRPLAR